MQANPSLVYQKRFSPIAATAGLGPTDRTFAWTVLLSSRQEKRGWSKASGRAAWAEFFAVDSVRAGLAADRIEFTIACVSGTLRQLALMKLGSTRHQSQCHWPCAGQH